MPCWEPWRTNKEILADIVPFGDLQKLVEKTLFERAMADLGVDPRWPILDALGSVTSTTSAWGPDVGDVTKMMEHCHDVMRAQDAIYGAPIKEIAVGDNATHAKVMDALRLAHKVQEIAHEFAGTRLLGVPFVVDEDLPPGIIEVRRVR
jgi:hypothetical protein